MALAEHLLGRAEELGSLRHLLAQLDEGRSAALELTGDWCPFVWRLSRPAAALMPRWLPRHAA